MSQGFHCHSSCDVSQNLCNPSAASEPPVSVSGDFPSRDPVWVLCPEKQITLYSHETHVQECEAPPGMHTHQRRTALLHLNSLTCIYNNIIYPEDKSDLTLSCTRLKASSQLFPKLLSLGRSPAAMWDNPTANRRSFSLAKSARQGLSYCTQQGSVTTGAHN